jgi:hypothetical protein
LNIDMRTRAGHEAGKSQVSTRQVEGERQKTGKGEARVCAVSIPMLRISFMLESSTAKNRT